MTARGGTVTGIGTDWTDVFVADAIGGSDGERCRGITLTASAAAKCRVFTVDGAEDIHRNNGTDFAVLPAAQSKEFTGIWKKFGISTGAIERVQVKADAGTVNCDISVNFN